MEALGQNWGENFFLKLAKIATFKKLTNLDQVKKFNITIHPKIFKDFKSKLVIFDLKQSDQS